ncbi:ribonuclease D [Cellulomonas hominis]
MVTIAEGDIPDSTASALVGVSRVAWDTETSGLDWRRDGLALCQLHAPEIGTVLVRMTEARPIRLIATLADERVQNVFHHAPFDLRFMRRAWGVRATNVLCTKVASKLLSPGAEHREHSLGALVQRELGVTLDKGDVRVSDWLVPQLSAQQVDYAAHDVEFLLPLADRLLDALEARGLGRLFVECCGFLPTQAEVSVHGIDDVFAY